MPDPLIETTVPVNTSPLLSELTLHTYKHSHRCSLPSEQRSPEQIAHVTNLVEAYVFQEQLPFQLKSFGRSNIFTHDSESLLFELVPSAFFLFQISALFLELLLNELSGVKLIIFFDDVSTDKFDVLNIFDSVTGHVLSVLFDKVFFVMILKIFLLPVSPPSPLIAFVFFIFFISVGRRKEECAHLCSLGIISSVTTLLPYLNIWKSHRMASLVKILVFIVVQLSEAHVAGCHHVFNYPQSRS